MTGGCVLFAPNNYAQISQKPMTNNKREAMTLSLSLEDKAQLTEVAEECGYGSVTAFVRAIAQRQIEIATENNLSRRIDVLNKHVKSQGKAIAQLQETVYKK